MESVNTDKNIDNGERGAYEDREGGRPPFRRSGRPAVNRRGGEKRKFFMKKKICFFCKNKESVLDYKDVNLMKRFIAESGKIVPRRFSGTCAKHQRKLSTEIKKARQMALIPYTDR
ncbi:MAG: 30S ribosomal protein S18 [Candidatus Cloacimonetes bacterium]|nr:30S ribosomal protein S18 [Candidatus Cloacimonadota bacterium]